MKRISLLLVLAAFCLLNTACTMQEKAAPESDKQAGISIVGITSSIGSVGENTDDFKTQSFKYTVTLQNNENDDITVTSVTPILSEGFSKLAADKDLTIKVDQAIPKGGSMSVTGEIIFDAESLTKEQITALEPFVIEVRIREERLIKKSF